ncbi:hypothetical protein [Faecalispora jeddahensis]|uniref:hypothetical protein n=1 Tax=Faecalispora jeddahensis TaxID=1414721 RepID=UPI0028A99C2D|nr:hypothetical protein [Faecalispora jeddahensis]
MNLIKNERGSSAISAITLAITILVLSAGIFEVFRINTAIQTVRDSLQTAVVDSCQENYADIYNGLREGYSGGYQLSGNEWVEEISAGDIYDKMDKALGMQNHVRYAGNSVDYKISNLTAQITNSPFAPDDPEEEDKLTCIAKIDLEIPLVFDWSGIAPMNFTLKVKAGYRPIF